MVSVVVRQSSSACHLTDDRVKRAVAGAAGSRNTANAYSGSPARRSNSMAVSRDFPIPASPESKTT